MREIEVKKRAEGEVRVPPDKSISHRAVILSSIAEGKSRIENLLHSEDCLATVRIMQRLGVPITLSDGYAEVDGVGLCGLRPTNAVLNAQNSGTTARLLSGLFSGIGGEFRLDGDEFLRKRPMSRVRTPLERMGAKFSGDYLPLTVTGGELTAIDYQMEVKSAQVKSAVLLAGLNAQGTTVVRERGVTRDHTERMLRSLGADVLREGDAVYLTPPAALRPFSGAIPADISSAAFFLVLGLILPDSQLTLKNVGVNPTRAGIIEVLKRMGGDITLENYREELEPVADITVKGSALHGITVRGEIIPNIIDEIPILTVAACFAEGETVIADAKELRVKESDRITAMVQGLSAMGADISEREDGFLIRKKQLKKAKADSFFDHRIAMSLAVAMSVTGGEIAHTDCVGISFPSFFEQLTEVTR